MNLPLGTLVNVIAVLVGSGLGLAFRSAIPEKYKQVIFQAIGLFTLFLGLKMAWDTNHFIVLVFALILGGILGMMLGIDDGLNGLSDRIRKKIKSDGNFNEGLVTAFVLFCMGSMTILGAIDEGLEGNRELLYTKSLLDGFSAIILTASFGIGVAFSVIPMFVFQVGITLGAQFLAPYLNPDYITEMSAVGGLMILAIGLNLLKIQEIKVSNFLPALLFAPLILYVINWLG